MSSRFWRLFVAMLRFGLPLAALMLHLVIVVCFARRWDKVAALTILPLWAWGAIGILLCIISRVAFRTIAAKWIMALWIVTIVVGSDETVPLLRSTSHQPQPGAPGEFAGKKVIRVASLNCRKMNRVTPEEVIPWQPDIVLLQEAPYPQFLEEFTKKLYPGGGMHVGAYECSVVTRGKLTILGIQGTPGLPSNFYTVLPATVDLDGRQVNVICVHLQGAITDLSLHQLDTWKKHYYNRLSRRAEIMDVRRGLWMNHLTRGPILIGGDFNAPAGDAVLRELEYDFTNAFSAAGSGWGNTYPNHFPLVRIDHILTNSQMKPIRARTVKTVNSDHRMLIADFVLE